MALNWQQMFACLIAAVRASTKRWDPMRFSCRNLRVGVLALALIFVAMAVTGRVRAEDSYREIIDARTGIRLSLPEQLLAKETTTRWGTNWTTVDKAIELDTLAYPESQDFRRLYDSLKGMRGRRLERDQWSEQAFSLGGRDQDGTRFRTDMRRIDNVIRGWSLVYSAQRTGLAQELIERLASGFNSLPGDPAALKHAMTGSTSVRIAAGKRGSGDTGRVTVEPNVGILKSDDFDYEMYNEAHFAPNGRILAISDGKRITLWEIATGRPLRTLDHFAYIRHFAFTSDGARIQSIHKDDYLREWDVLSGAFITEYRTDSSNANANVLLERLHLPTHATTTGKAKDVWPILVIDDKIMLVKTSQTDCNADVMLASTTGAESSTQVLDGPVVCKEDETASGKFGKIKAFYMEQERQLYLARDGGGGNQSIRRFER